jgi:hypothetical protein
MRAQYRLLSCRDEPEQEAYTQEAPRPGKHFSSGRREFLLEQGGGN